MRQPWPRASACLLAATVMVAAVAVGRAAEDAPVPAQLDPTQPTQVTDYEDLSQVPRLLRKMLFRAITKENRGDFGEAATMLQDHLRGHPDQDHMLVRLHLGQCLSSLDKPADARVQFEAATRLQPNFAKPWLGLGDAAYALQDYAAAAAAFERGFRLSADPPADVLYYAAAARLQANQTDRAVPLLQELVSGRWGTPKLAWFRAFVSAAVALGEPELAQAPMDDLLKTNPDDPEVWYLDYQFEAGRQDFERAAVALTIVGYLRDATAQEKKALGDLYSVVGVPRLAGEQYEDALGDSAKATDYERVASSYVAAHDPDTAMQFLERGLKKEPTVRLWSLLGDVHYLRRDYAAAAQSYQQVVAMDPDRGRGYLMLGYCAIEMGQRQVAIANLRVASTYTDQEAMAQALLKRAERLGPS